ncbi:MAG: bifunctional precorrin-2 dehydrogenase/sirohydrochlorin ferrochelatase [Flavobacteriaceae bacterium]|nr:bifunctional precorrin-2 dehydrogenase/sirohydrochlorin ferrochelatase [Flavobacteriaceae bacterium]
MEQNKLYPIFLKASQLNILIVGGGKVALEKLRFLLKSSPNANVLLAAISFDENILKMAESHSVSLVKTPYSKAALKNKQIVIAATNNTQINKQIYRDAKAENILINVADTPDLCDFYLGGIVTKGQVKIAISTNGKSPTLAKRLRQFFEDVIPDDIDELAQNLNEFRQSVKGSFEEKVSTLNKLTKSLLDNK